jgi:hypothetical protein
LPAHEAFFGLADEGVEHQGAEGENDDAGEDGDPEDRGQKTVIFAARSAGNRLSSVFCLPSPG